MTDSSSESPQETKEPADVEPKPITIEQFTDSLTRLVDRGKEAGLHPARIMLGTYVKKLTDAVEGFLGGLEGDSQEKKK
jgi:hypothetical protein